MQQFSFELGSNNPSRTCTMMSKDCLDTVERPLWGHTCNLRLDKLSTHSVSSSCLVCPVCPQRWPTIIAMQLCDVNASPLLMKYFYIFHFASLTTDSQTFSKFKLIQHQEIFFTNKGKRIFFNSKNNIHWQWYNSKGLKDFGEYLARPLSWLDFTTNIYMETLKGRWPESQRSSGYQ